MVIFHSYVKLPEGTWALSFLWAFFSPKSPAMQVYDAVIVWMTARWYQVRRKCFSRSSTWNLHMFNAFSMHPPYLKYFTAERWSFSACSGEIEFLTFLAVAIPAIPAMAYDGIWWHDSDQKPALTTWGRYRNCHSFGQEQGQTWSVHISSYKFIRKADDGRQNSIL